MRRIGRLASINVSANVSAGGVPKSPLLEAAVSRSGVAGDRQCDLRFHGGAPCSTIGGSFADRDFRRISHQLHPGWSRMYARVLVEGVIRAGDRVEVLVEGPEPRTR